ncbi:MAG TPA: ABC transporter substrate binding protein [Noviherbaspirillum sp.]|nr:ABC transporter substrate binding protein [Noviherbaspirillum sp.]
MATKSSNRGWTSPCKCLSRAALGLLFAFAVSSANAQSPDWTSTLAYTDLHHQQDLTVNPFEFRSNFHMPRFDLSPVSLAELGDVTKRFDAQAAGAVAVVYPDIGEPYRSVFAKIIEGIEDGARQSVRIYPIGPNHDPAELNALLKKNGTKVVIALGRQGLKATSSLDSTIPVVVGGVLAIPEAENRSLMGISLTPDPALLFTRLKNLMPGVKRVIVVYNPQHNEWLIKIAREAAKAQGVELATYEARDLAAAARAYESAFASADSRRDAVWLPQDATTVDENTILPLVLKESWNRNVPVFSSSFLHVKKGALFALYPNNLELGRTLATSALAVMSGDARRRGVLPLREVQTAVNLRTASHIGLTIGYQQQRSFDFIFPEP